MVLTGMGVYGVSALPPLRFPRCASPVFIFYKYNMTTDSGSFMVVFLILILIFSLFIIYIVLDVKKTSESYDNYQAFRGRAPDGPPGCCGNLDWYMGTQKYNEYCAGKEGGCGGEKLEEYFGNLQENLSGFQRQSDECKQKGLKAAYNPSVCTDEDSYVPAANCKCVDDKNNCKECYEKINFGTGI